MKRISSLLLILLAGLSGCDAKTSVLIEILGPSSVVSLELEVQRPDRKITRALIPSPGPSLSLPADVIVILPDATATIALQLAGTDSMGNFLEAHATVQSRPHHQVSVTMTLDNEGTDLALLGDLTGADLSLSGGGDGGSSDLRGASTGDGSSGDLGGVPSLQLLSGLPGTNDVSFDGVGRDARLLSPQQPVLVGTSLYFFDYWDSGLRKVDVATGVVTTVPLTDDDNGGQALYAQGTVGLAWDGNNKLYVSNDIDNTIRVVTLDDGHVKVFVGAVGSPGFADSPSPPRFNGPEGLAFDANGNLWVADGNNATIREVVISATPTVTTPAGLHGATGYVDNSGANARFTQPRGLTFYNGNLYITDGSALRELVPTPSPAAVSTIIPAGSWADYPQGLASAGGGIFYVLDDQRNNLRMVTLPSTQIEVAGRPSTGSGNQYDAVSVDGVGAAARFTDPGWCTLDGAGTMYITENGAVRKVTLSDYTVTTLAGMSAQTGSNDTPDVAGSDETPARFYEPAGLAFDGVDTVYVADYANNRIRTVSLSTGVTGTLAGNDKTDSIDGKGTGASFGNPAGMARDNAGNLYVADYTTNTVRQIAPSGDVLTIAGIDNSSGPPSPTPTPIPGTSARLNHPDSLEFDGDHTLFLSDPGNNVIRSIDLSSPQFLIATLAGSGASGTSDGVGTAASFASPHGLAWDANAKILYVSDYDSNLIRTIDLTNRAAPMVGKLAGFEYESGTSDGTFGSARFYAPLGLALDSARALLWVADTGNNTVRRLDLVHRMTSTPIGTAGVPVTKPGAVPGFVHGPWAVLLTPRGLVITSWDENSVLLATGL